MTHIMDIADGTVYPVEEPCSQLQRESHTELRDPTRQMEYPQLQLAIIETQIQAETMILPPAAIDALIKAIED